MKLIVLLLALNTIAVSVSFADGEGHEHGDKTELHKIMENWEKEWKFIVKNSRKQAKNAITLKAIDRLLVIIDSAKPEKPAMTDDLSVNKRAGFFKSYQERIEKFKAGLEKVKTLLISDKNSEARLILKVLNSQKKAGHGDFKKEEE
ncbi:MAG: hypothetical protein HOE90_20175 [Bacteriovoracaceae bacterium]|jgi:hypothetical protein|nr:hypothetical protein [Bacteriovoracaceae bacterium]